MPIDLRGPLTEAEKRNALPKVIAHNRIDGPGSSLDLREFQQALWSLPNVPEQTDADHAAEWTRRLPRTVGITIDAGTSVEAQPLDPGMIAVSSVEYGTEVIAKAGDVPPTKENWLLKIMDLFRLSGVRFFLHNLKPGLQSSGLGGSATAATGVCVLANELAGRPFGRAQLASMASRIEQDLGVSYTGTQEQSNVMFGGVVDYVWFPWGIPGRPETGYGTSVRFEIMPPEAYTEIEERMAVFHTGMQRASTDVNSIWVEALFTADGYRLHREKLDIAYRFREAIRVHNWSELVDTTNEYRAIRTQVCANYMDGAEEIHGFAEAKGCAVFPLGAGGGGAVLIVAAEPDALKALQVDLDSAYRAVPFRIMEKGHKLVNLPLSEQ